MKIWRDCLIEDKCVKAIPVMTNPGVELSGHSIKEAVQCGAVHAQSIISLNEKYPESAACTMIMDLTVEAEAFGAQLVFEENDAPNVVGRLLSEVSDVEKLQVPSLEVGRIAEYLEADRIVAQAISDKPVFAGCIGPFSLAGRLYGMTEAMMAIYIEPDLLNSLLEKCTEFSIKYLKAVKETGVNGVILAEPAAGLLSGEDCMEYSTRFVKKIVEAVQDERFMLVLHNCGNAGQCTAAMVESGAMGLHFGNVIDLAKAASEVPSEVLVMGNLDPVGILKLSTPEKIKDQVLKLLDDMKAFDNFILSTGCEVPPQVSFDNIDAFYDALGQYNS